MNRETAITQQQLNMINQYNPWGSVEYRQTGTQFTPGTSGSRYYYNSSTGEYRPVSGGFGGGSPSSGSNPFSSLVGLGGGDAGRTIDILGSAPKNSEAGGSSMNGHPGEGWEIVRGSLTPSYSQFTNLTPEQQAIFDQSQQAELNLAQLAASQSAFLQDHFSKPFEYTNRDAETWAWDLASPRILEQQRQNQAALQTQLRNQGLAPGSAAWNAEMNRLTNANTDQLNQLALTGRQQGFAEALATRNQPINEITALLSGSQVSNPASMSSPAPQTGVAGVDYTGLVNNKYNAEMSAYNSGMNALGGLFGLGAKALFSSDRRLKRDIKRIGVLSNGIGWYEYNYLTDDENAPKRRGVMSDEVRKVIPEAVIVDSRGFDMVDYGMLNNG